jgi:predicted DNA-binding protein with PD1-like motif
VTWAKVGSFFQLRLEPGEDVVSSVVAFVREHGIGSGLVTGLGAAEDVVLGYFDRKRREYVKRRFPGECEIASMTGNIAWAGAEPVCHLHAVVAAKGLTARAGHLFEARVAVTCELNILPGEGSLYRSEDPETGLNLLDLPRGGQEG